MSSAVVVGAGPNGLAAAVELARSGLEVRVLERAETIGGGTRTSELTVGGVLHDHCSAAHPMAVGSPYLKELDLGRHGLEWAWAELDLAHPLDDGTAGVMVRSIESTAAGLGAGDGRRWQRLFGPSARAFDALGADLMKPVLHVPHHPLALTRFGLRTLLPARTLARRFSTPQARALWAGTAAHGFTPLTAPMSSAVGMALTCAAHTWGWPVAVGGSRAITDALAAALAEHGGSIETGVEVGALDELGSADVVVFDLAPGAVAEIAGERLPARVARAYRRYRHGPGAFKLDLAVEGGVPWTNADCARAGTVHVGGSLDEIVHAEAEINRGRMPARPFVLVAQQYLADPSRSAGDTHPVWAYAHVPSGYPGDATEAILAQIERFAPGLRERIVAIATRATTEFPEYNPNYVGGDINGGAQDIWQLFTRPVVKLNPYATPVPGIYLCSSSTPPGGGVHGMCGHWAARLALRRELGLR